MLHSPRTTKEEGNVLISLHVAGTGTPQHTRNPFGCSFLRMHLLFLHLLVNPCRRTGESGKEAASFAWPPLRRVQIWLTVAQHHETFFQLPTVCRSSCCRPLPPRTKFLTRPCHCLTWKPQHTSAAVLYCVLYFNLPISSLPRQEDPGVLAYWRILPK